MNLREPVTAKHHAQARAALSASSNGLGTVLLAQLCGLDTRAMRRMLLNHEGTRYARDADQPDRWTLA